MNNRDKQAITKSFRISVKAEEILKEVSKRDFREFATISRYALLEYVQKRHPDLYEALAEEFTPQ
jgi:predicted DNA-binding protein